MGLFFGLAFFVGIADFFTDPDCFPAGFFSTDFCPFPVTASGDFVFAGFAFVPADFFTCFFTVDFNESEVVFFAFAIYQMFAGTETVSKIDAEITYVFYNIKYLQNQFINN